MKITVILPLLLLLLFLPNGVCAETGTYESETRTEASDRLFAALPKETAESLRQAGVDIRNENFAEKLSLQSVGQYLVGWICSGGKRPLQTGGALTALVLLAAAVTALLPEQGNARTVGLICTAAVGICVAPPVWQTVQAAAQTVRACGTFLVGFVPVFSVFVALGGATVTAASSGAVLLGAATVLSGAISAVVLPLSGCCLALHLTGGVSPLLSGEHLPQALQKAVFWILSLLSTVFIGVLGIQTAVGAATDGVALKTAKFLVGTAVPVAGNALSEAASALAASVTLLRSSVAVFGVIALAAMLLPVVAELLLWRGVLTVSALLAQAFGLSSSPKMLRAVEQMLGMLVTVLLLCGAALILGLAVVVQTAPTA